MHFKIKKCSALKNEQGPLSNELCPQYHQLKDKLEVTVKQEQTPSFPFPFSPGSQFLLCSVLHLFNFHVCNWLHVDCDLCNLDRRGNAMARAAVSHKRPRQSAASLGGGEGRARATVLPWQKPQADMQRDYALWKSAWHRVWDHKDLTLISMCLHIVICFLLVGEFRYNCFNIVMLCRQLLGYCLFYIKHITNRHCNIQGDNAWFHFGILYTIKLFI